MEKYQKIIFQDKPYILIDRTITTIEDFKNGEQGYAIIIGDDIKRYGEIIGKRKDITFLDEYAEIEITLDIMLKHAAGFLQEEIERAQPRH